MNVLLTNDDGIRSRGIQTLKAALREDCDLILVAPATERSASSHAISLGQKLRVEEKEVEGIREYSVHGTPADCVKFALSEIDFFKPDLILSGINQGSNTGISVFYSGTISAAREGMINGVPSAAVSLCSRDFKDFTAAAQIAHELVEGYLQKQISPGVMLNVNVPPVPPSEVKGVRICKQAASRFIEEFIREKDHDGRHVYSLAGEIELYDPDGSSDEETVAEGYIAITPLKIDLTDYQEMKTLEEWSCRKRT